jgi:DNA-binding NarL/FixJ family response regulator
VATSSIRILLVDDYEPFRRFLSSMLQNSLEVEFIYEVSDGSEAVRRAEELQPDLILLDIGLPKLNGIEAARRIREVSPQSKILFLSQGSSADVVQEALSTGAEGYVVKTDARRELLTAVNAVLRGERFVGSRVARYDFTRRSHEKSLKSFQRDTVLAPLDLPNMGISRRHEVQFYSDDDLFLHGFTQFIGAALKAGNAVIVVATESHRKGLLPRLQAHGSDIAAAIEQGRYISLDAAETLSTFMVNDLPDPARFLKVAGDLIMTAANVVKGERARVAACGECAHLLWAQGNAEAAIQLEHLWDGIARSYAIDVLCGYPLGSFQGGVGSHIFERVCAEHSAVHSR